MIDKEKVYDLLGRHICFVKGGLSGIDPDVEDSFWLPMLDELSKDVDETIVLLEEFDKTEFECAIEIIDELIEKTQSHKLLEVISRIGIEKKVNEVYLRESIKRASAYFSELIQNRLEKKIKYSSCYLILNLFYYDRW